MKRRILFGAIALAAITLATASLAAMPHLGTGEPVDAAGMLAEYPFLDGRLVAELTVNDYLQVAEQASVAIQQRHYVASIAARSFILPGLGQFAVGKTGAGVAHLLTHVGVVGGTLAGAYLLRPDGIDDVAWNVDAIEAYFRTVDFRELLPSLGVMAAGSMLSWVNRSVSAKSAARVAAEQVADGTVTFEPDLRFVGAHLFLGLRVGQ